MKTIKKIAILGMSLPMLMIAANSMGGDHNDGTFSFVAGVAVDFSTIKVAGHTNTAGSLQGPMIITQSTHKLFAINDVFKIKCNVYADIFEKSLTLVSYCKSTDSSGNEFYTLAKRSAGNIKSGGKSMLKILGGTGKFKNLTANCPYTVKYLKGGKQAAIAYTCVTTPS